MIDDQLSPEEQNLVLRIQSVPKPKLDSVARDAIRERIVNEFRASNFPDNPHALPTGPRVSMQLIAALVALTMVIVAVGLIIAQNRSQNAQFNTETPALTPSPGSQIVVVPSATSGSAVETMTATATITPEIVPSLSPTLPPPTEIPPSSTPLIPTQEVIILTEMPPTSTPLAPTQEVIILIEGPVISITGNIVSIYDFRIEVEAQHPILQVIDVGDVVRVQGVMGGNGAVAASIVSNIPSDTPATAGATVGLDGPIEAINGNTIIVNGIPVQLSPDDPLLQTVQPGNFVRVQGNFEHNGTTIVLVVVNMVIINNVIVDDNPNCWFHVDGMGMGHWHCDGMGMGMGMGMER